MLLPITHRYSGVHMTKKKKETTTTINNHNKNKKNNDDKKDKIDTKVTTTQEEYSACNGDHLSQERTQNKRNNDNNDSNSSSGCIHQEQHMTMTASIPTSASTKIDDLSQASQSSTIATTMDDSMSSTITTTTTTTPRSKSLSSSSRSSSGRKLVDFTKQRATPEDVLLFTRRNSKTDNGTRSPFVAKRSASLHIPAVSRPASTNRQRPFARSLTCSDMISSTDATANTATTTTTCPSSDKPESSADDPLQTSSCHTFGTIDSINNSWAGLGLEDKEEDTVDGENGHIRFFLKVPLDRKRRTTRRRFSTTSSAEGMSHGSSALSFQSGSTNIVEELREKVDNSRRRQRRRSLLQGASLSSNQSVDSTGSTTSGGTGSFCGDQDVSWDEQQQQQKLAIEEQLDREDREALQRHFIALGETGTCNNNTLQTFPRAPSLSTSTNTESPASPLPTNATTGGSTTTNSKDDDNDNSNDQGCTEATAPSNGPPPPPSTPDLASPRRRVRRSSIIHRSLSRGPLAVSPTPHGHSEEASIATGGDGTKWVVERLPASTVQPLGGASSPLLTPTPKSKRRHHKRTNETYYSKTTTRTTTTTAATAKRS